jgi:hypothetical protein
LLFFVVQRRGGLRKEINIVENKYVNNNKYIEKTLKDLKKKRQNASRVIVSLAATQTRETYAT